MKLVIFCEAAADFRTASDLVDRVLHEHGPEWVRDLVPSHPESVREWVSDGQGRAYFDLHKLDAYRRGFKGLRFRQGHFDGKPGEADAQSARNAFTIARELHKQDPIVGSVRLYRVGSVPTDWGTDPTTPRRRYLRRLGRGSPSALGTSRAERRRRRTVPGSHLWLAGRRAQRGRADHLEQSAHDRPGLLHQLQKSARRSAGRRRLSSTCAREGRRTASRTSLVKSRRISHRSSLPLVSRARRGVSESSAIPSS